MLTQEAIDLPGRSIPVKNKPIRIMDPTPGNGWGCIPPVDIIRVLRKVAQEQGKAVEVQEVKHSGVKRTVAILALLLTAAIFSIGTIISMVRP